MCNKRQSPEPSSTLRFVRYLPCQGKTKSSTGHRNLPSKYTTPEQSSNMNRTIELNLERLIPRHSGALPRELKELTSSLLAQSRTKCNLGAEEEAARIYLCANLACERYVFARIRPLMRLTKPYLQTQNHSQPTTHRKSSSNRTPSLCQTLQVL